MDDTSWPNITLDTKRLDVPEQNLEQIALPSKRVVILWGSFIAMTWQSLAYEKMTQNSRVLPQSGETDAHASKPAFHIR
jgi:hypothetical protein